MNLLHRLHLLRVRVTSSLWFVPGLCVLVGVVLALSLTAMDSFLDERWISKESRFFGVGTEGSRGMLAAIAGSMMTVASLSFSLTISTLATASSQYTSRLIRNFMRDGVNQFVLGYFVGLFSYCLIVLRAIRSADEGSFVPSFAVLAGLILAIVSVGVLIYFIHHIAESIQASVILDRVTDETLRSIDRMFPADAGEPSGGTAAVPDQADDARTQWHGVPAERCGFIESINTASIIGLATEHDTVIRMEADVGAFVTRLGRLCSVAGTHAPDEKTLNALRQAFSIGQSRSIEQDPAFGVRQIVDIGLKALSPGINDTTTGVMCLQHLGAILERLARRDIPDRFRAEDGTLRLIARGRSFETLVRLALDQIRLCAKANVEVMVAALRAVAVTARQIDDNGRRVFLLEQAELFAKVAADTLVYDYDRDVVRVALAEVCAAVVPLRPSMAAELLPQVAPKPEILA